MTQKRYYARNWLIDATVRTDELLIEEGASFSAPEGKFLTLTVNGVGTALAPGVYKGEAVITVSDIYKMPPHGLMTRNGTVRDFHCAAVVTDGEKSEKYGVPDAIFSGSITGKKAEKVFIASDEDSFNGILVAGNTEYEVNDCKFYLDGFGADDFSGVGAGVAAIDDSRVTINDSEFSVNGVTRCAVHVGGDSRVRVNNCKISNHSPASDWVKDFSWQVGFSGTNRLCQLTDNAKAWYTGCDLRTNGWGILSIDGSDEPVEMHVKDCRMELEGPRAHGYGAFCIGDNFVGFEHCEVNVNGYPLLLMGMEGAGRAEITGGTVINGRRFGMMVVDDDNSVLTIADSEVNSRKASIVMKGSSTVVDIRNSAFRPQNGVVLQLMDNDEGGMSAADFKIPLGVKDEYIPGRDLTTASDELDVIIKLADSEITGNFYNSTSNIRARDLCTKGGMGKFHDSVIGIMAPPPPPPPGEEAAPPAFGAAARHNGDDLQGPKNLCLRLSRASVTGVISSASQKYRDGLALITLDNWYELSNVTQEAAPTVNNGVIVELDGESAWTVTEVSYISALKLAPGAKLSAPEGKRLAMTIDGVETPPAPGEYKGKIVLSII